MGARAEDRVTFHWGMTLVFSSQFVGHLQQCSEVAVFSHLTQLSFNSKVMRWSLPLPSLKSLMKTLTLLQGRLL